MEVEKALEVAGELKKVEKVLDVLKRGARESLNQGNDARLVVTLYFVITPSSVYYTMSTSVYTYVNWSVI